MAETFQREIETVEATYRCDGTHVAHEMVDGEVIAIDFRTGAYFSMRGTAARIWTALIGGASRQALCAAAAPFGGARDVGAFVDELVGLDLITPGLMVPGAGTGAVGAVALPDYAPPVIERFEDMAELMMLDPIHDVAPQGWPHA
ncbi:hypothetical protein GTZ99_15315 [Novosphingobium sp. FSY-8]|uniref:Coenzyme PQQ synthesis protein D (PqqD) n=1 Tax=Novosphingobium ovatum TaxID=1908523 RepID=A0ABW9XH79_9SPHN|nr:PqqD family protein [Novosphingobium ovatum]NBC37923.1 hypothetical protein [Novosphingobium ovatum]